MPTASAVVADLVDSANDRYSFTFGVKTSDLVEAAVVDISERVGRYFVKVVVDKNLAQKSNLAEAIFGAKIKIHKTVFVDKGEEILCAFLIENQKEQDLVEALKTLDSNLAKSVKFLRVEDC